MVVATFTSMKYLYFFIITFLGLEACHDEQAARSRDAQIKQALVLAAQSGDKEDYNEQLLQLEKVVALSRQTNDSLSRWIRANTQIADLLDLDLGKRLESLERLHTTDQELAVWRSPQTLLEHQLLLRHYLLEAYIAVEVGDMPRAQKVFEKAAPVFKNSVSGTNDTLAGNYYKQIANLYVRLGEFKIAKQYFEESKVYVTVSGDTGVANYNDYGSVFLSQNDYKSALMVFNQGLVKGSPNYYNQTLLFLNKAEALARLGEIQAAVETNEIAGLMLQDTSKWAAIKKSRRARCQIGYLENKGIISEELQDWEKQGTYFHQIVYSPLAGYLPRREIAAYMANEAYAFRQMHQYPQALARYHDAYMQFYPSASKEDMFEMPAASDLLTDKILADVLEGKAQCFAQLGQFKNALQLYELIPVVEAQLLATHTFESSYIFSLKKSRKRFDDAVELAWKAWKNTGDHHFASMAFRFTEMARGVLQNKGIRMNDAYAALREADQEQDKNYATRIASAETELAELDNKDESRANVIMQTIRDLKKQQQNFRNDLIKTNPVYAAAISNEKICAINEAKNLLRPDQILLDYYLIDTVALYVFIADQRGNVSWQRIVWHQNGELSRFLGFMSKRNDKDDIADFIPVAHQLYQTLLAPVFQHISTGEGLCEGSEKITPGTSLVIIPDMELAGLPFEALVTDTVGLVKKWGSLPYFLHQFNVAYAYSASLLQLQQDITSKRVGAARMPFAGFAPSYSNRDMLLENAEKDVYYGKKLFGGDTYTQNTATEAAYRKIAEEAQILLFSMHGYANYEEPMLSNLRFGDSDDGPFEKNNSLTAGEIQHIPCRADLVVMSACHTGDGPLEQGEGVYSMARAFTISGVPSTVMSLWFLPEVSSSCMVQDFLTGIHQKQPKDVALRTAKLAWIKEQQGSKSKPYFWACFVTAGDMSPLDIAGSRLNWWYWVVGLVCFTAAILYFRRK